MIHIVSTTKGYVHLLGRIRYFFVLQETTYCSNGSTKHEKTVIDRREHAGMVPNSCDIWSVERIKVP